GRSTRTSRQGATPSRHRLLVPLSACAPSLRCRSTPFSFCKLATGTTTAELVTSGRSVSIGLFGPVHSPAVAADAKPVNNPATSTVEARSRTKFAIATRGAVIYRGVPILRAASLIRRPLHLLPEPTGKPNGASVRQPRCACLHGPVASSAIRFAHPML